MLLAAAGTGEPDPYVDRLDALRDGLVASGELGGLEVTGGAPLYPGPGLVRRRNCSGPAVLPLVLLSPGNATNAGFYAGLAEELASHGFAVAGVDHPF